MTDLLDKWNQLKQLRRLAMTTKRNKLKWYGLAAIAVIAFALTLHLIGPAKIQGQGKVKRTISELKYYPSTVKPPVRVRGLKVNGQEVNFSSMFEEDNRRLEKPVRSDEEFEEGDDFIEKTTFEVINVSEKKIIWIRFMMHLYTQNGVNKRSFDAAFAVDYGRPAFAHKPPYSWVISPGETATISIPEEMLPDVRRIIGEIGSKIVRVGVYASVVEFDDGSSWSGTSGRFSTPKTSKQSSLNRL